MNRMQEQVEEFHRACELTIGAYPAVREGELRARLILEEAIETAYALLLPSESPTSEEYQDTYNRLTSLLLSQLANFNDNPDHRMLAVIDGICDSLYVQFGTAVALGIDITPFFNEVHQANMTKTLGPKDAGGKQLKPEGWTGPDHGKVLKRLYGVQAPDLDGDLVPPDRWQHIADADDSTEPFDWSDHTESDQCQCCPRVDPPFIIHRREIGEIEGEKRS